MPDNSLAADSALCSDASNKTTPAPPDEVVSQGPVFVVINPSSGSHSTDEVVEQIGLDLARSGRGGDLFLATGDSSVTDLAELAASRAQREGGIVVVAGGDGTVSAVARAVIERGVALAVIPAGTFNLVARAHGISENIAEAIRIALSGRVVPVQVGRVSDLLFLVNASIGLYPKLLRDRETLKRQLGRSRFVALLAAAKTLAGTVKPMSLALNLDGRAQRLRTTSLFIGNNRLQIDRLGLSEAQAIGQGYLVLLNAPPFGMLTAIKLLIQAALGRLKDAKGLDATTFETLAVTRVRRSRARRPFGVAIDGEAFRVEPPLVFSVEPKPLWLIVARAEALASTAKVCDEQAQRDDA